MGVRALHASRPARLDVLRRAFKVLRLELFVGKRPKVIAQAYERLECLNALSSSWRNVFGYKVFNLRQGISCVFLDGTLLPIASAVIRLEQ